MNILLHLENLTDYIIKGKRKIPYINVYSRFVGSKLIPIYADGEGKACVDDVARASVLALEVYEFTKDQKALETGLNWINFLDYMTNDKGLIFNFIDRDNNPVDKIKSSYPGGAWWTARAKFAYAKAYRVTGEASYLKKYFNLKIEDNFDADVASLLLIAGSEIGVKKNKTYLYNLANSIYINISPTGYMVHRKGDNEIHLWGYHQLEGIIRAYTIFGEDRFLNIFNKTIEIVVQDAIENKFYYSYPSRTKEGLCAYCISPIARGLFQAYNVTRDQKYKVMFLKCVEWFHGFNDFNQIVYDTDTGACRDGIRTGELSKDCGAESSIEAGYVELRRANLGGDNEFNSGQP